MKEHTALIKSASKIALQNFSFAHWTQRTGRLLDEPGQNAGPSPHPRLAAPLQSELFMMRRQSEQAVPKPDTIFFPLTGPSRSQLCPQPASPPAICEAQGTSQEAAPAAPACPASSGSRRRPGSSPKSSPPGSRAALPVAGQGNAQWAQLSRVPPALQPAAFPRRDAGPRAGSRAARRPSPSHPRRRGSGRENSACSFVRLSVRPAAPVAR